MPLGEIPPWLQVNPQQSTQAAEAGGRLGLESAGQANEVQNQNLNRIQQANLATAARGQQAAESAAQQQLEAERLAAQQAEAQQRLQLETQAAARKFQAQQGYAQAVQSGQDPIHAMMQFGPLMGESMSGLGPLSLSQTRMKQAAIPPSAVMGPDGKPVGYTYDGQMHMLPSGPKQPAKVPEKMLEYDKQQQLFYQKQLEQADKDEAALPPDLEATKDSNAASRQGIEARRKKAQEGLDDLEKEYKGDKGSGAKTAQGGYKIGATYKGGLKYLGGDPNDEASWQQAGSAAQ